MSAAPTSGETYLSFDGTGYVEIPSLPAYSADRTGELTVAAWIKADVEEFRHQEGTNYVHWMGKGDRSGPHGNQEWVCRMYSKSTADHREKRTSFYLFNPQGRLGVGSFVQEDVPVGTWRLIVGMADRNRTYLYRNGELMDSDIYRGPGRPGGRMMRDGSLGPHLVINPLAGNAPLRIGTQDKRSFFQGGISRVRIWGRVLTPAEIRSLHESDVASRDWLVGEFLLNRDTGKEALDTAYENHGKSFGGAAWAVQG